jgi:hypothetical protein
MSDEEVALQLLRLGGTSHGPWVSPESSRSSAVPGDWMGSSSNGKRKHVDDAAEVDAAKRAKLERDHSIHRMSNQLMALEKGMTRATAAPIAAYLFDNFTKLEGDTKALKGGLDRLKRRGAKNEGHWKTRTELDRSIELHPDGSIVVSLKEEVGEGASKFVKAVGLVERNPRGELNVLEGVKLRRWVDDDDDEKLADEELQAHEDTRGLSHVIQNQAVRKLENDQGQVIKVSWVSPLGRDLETVIYGNEARGIPPSQLEPEEIRRMARGALKGLAQLHAANKVHNDIKPANLLSFQRDSKSCTLVGDLDLVETIGAPSLGGSEGYYPPEFGSRDDYDPDDPDERPRRYPPGDCYAMGKTLFELVHRRTPSPSLDRGGRLNGVPADPPVDLSVPMEHQHVSVQAVIEGLMAYDPDQRLTAEQARILMKTATF